MSQKNTIENNVAIVVFLILVAYLFSVGIRMYWPIHFSDTLSMYYNNQLMINTNDGYFFASGAKDIIDGIIPNDRVRLSASTKGLSEITALLAQLLPYSLDTIVLYMPAFISSLVVIPIILVARLMGHTFLGFFAALIGGITWSYYNRTMVGYYDSDMFAIFLQFSIFYSFFNITYKRDIFSILFSSFLVLIYPYFYPQGISITFAMFIFLLFYLIFEYNGFFLKNDIKKDQNILLVFYKATILLSIALMSTLLIEIKLVLFLLALFVLIKKKIKEEELIILAIISFLGFIYFSNLFNVILGYLTLYTSRGVGEDESLHFYQVIQTVREAGAIPFSTIANRISGSMIGLLLSVIGFIFLIVRYKSFIIALPLIGVGLFSYVGGLRFTVYAVPIAGLSVVYLFWFLSSQISNKISIKYLAVVLGTLGMLYPNIQHVINYTVPTVLNKTEVEDLELLKKISTRKDYTLAWWDYGFPIWYYSNTSTLIDGGKHQNDNYIISKIMQTTSPKLAAGLGRLAIETYVDSNYSIVANKLFKKNNNKNINPEKLMTLLSKGNYSLPKKSRDIYLYLPYRMLNIFPTVNVFGNINLRTGKPKRNINFYPTSGIKQIGTKVMFKNGIVFDSSTGFLKLGKQTQKVYHFDQVKLGKNAIPKLEISLMHLDGNFCIVNLQSYNRVIIMDKETYNSMYVQMFMLGNYDKELFELVVSSPYTKIYKIKK